MMMATKAMNLKFNEEEILLMKQVASVFNMTVTDIVKEAVNEYIEKMMQDPFYKLTMNVEDAGTEETNEILDEISSLTDDDLAIVSSRRFEV